MATISSFPSELLAAVFQFCDLPDLLLAGRVCGRWRAICMDHPCYWSKVVVDSLSPRQLALAKSRIAAGLTRPVYLEISLPQEDVGITEIVIPLLLSVLPRISHLEITINELYLHELWDMLQTPMPDLILFSLVAASSKDSSRTGPVPLPLPSNIFGGCVERLVEVRLDSVPLAHNVVPAFANANVGMISFRSDTQQYFPSFLFRCFPSMSRLHIAGGTIDFDTPVPSHAASGLARLDYFDVEYGDELASLLRSSLVASIPTLSIAFATPGAVYAALEALPRPLQMTIYHHHALEFHIALSTTDSRSRHFAEHFIDYDDLDREQNILLSDTAFVDQLSAVVISLSLWNLLHPHLPVFAKLAKFVLWIDDASRDVVKLPQLPRATPKLATLSIASEYEFSYIDVHDLVRFADALGCGPVLLELVRILLVGPPSVLESRFTEIHHRNIPSLVWWPGEEETL